MTYVDEQPAGVCASRCGRIRRDLGAAVAAAVSGMIAWAAVTGFGDHELTVRAGSDVREVGIVSVAVAAVVVAVGGALLLRGMVARIERGLFWWTVVACGALLVSLLGPLGATDAADRMGLLSLHAVVGVAVIVGLRRAYRDR